jgi:ceramide glucosyltransferase
VLVAHRLEGMAFTLGATMATTRSALASIGGFEALADYCADDFELGHRLAARGQSIVLAESVVSTESAARDGIGFLHHQLRWAVTLRHSRPWGYVGKIAFTQGLPWALAAIGIAPSAPIAAAYALAYLCVRCAMAWSAAGVVEDDMARRKLYLVPVADAFAFGISVAALCSNRINWRGRWFELRKGRLVPAGTSRGGPTINEVRP